MTSKWEKICPAADLPAGRRKRFPVGAIDLLIINTGKRYYACANECPHLGESLEEKGEMHGHVIRCTSHGNKLDLATGKSVTDADMEIPIFQVEVRDGWVCVKT